MHKLGQLLLRKNSHDKKKRKYSMCTELGNRNCAHSEFIIKQFWIKNEITFAYKFCKKSRFR